MSQSKLLAVLGITAGTVILGCGSGGAAKAVQPSNPTFAGATGGETLKSGATCHEVGDEGTPLIVDWPADRRLDLEAAMKDGAAIVHYDCNSFKLLTDCHNKTKTPYGFIGTTKREQVVSLANGDEVKANLPLQGGSVGGGMSRGQTLDIGLMMIGKRATTAVDISRDELEGKCDGATHFVRSATVGAFAMQTGTAGEVKVAAKMFGIGASGASSSTLGMQSREGDPTACDSADSDAKDPPKKCGGLLRIQLVGLTGAKKDGDAPIAAAAGKANAKKSNAVSSSLAASETLCPTGLVGVEGKCTAPVANVAHECRPGDAQECSAQCDLGNLPSCAKYGFMLTDMSGKAKYDETKSLAAFRKACDGGNAAGCSGLGDAYTLALGVAEDHDKAFKLYQSSCAAGFADACDNLGQSYEAGWGVRKDPAKGASIRSRACNAGSSNACITIGEYYEKGKGGFSKDMKSAVMYYAKACDGGSGESCEDLGERFAKGDGVPTNKSLSLALYQKGCSLGATGSCYTLGDNYAKGDGVAADSTKATEYYKRACKLYKTSPACKKPGVR